MKILSIDTASNLCTVAILDDNKCKEEIIVDDARNHSEKIMPVIEEAFTKTNLKLTDMDLIVCDKGPGSFTGIRIGVGTVLAFQDSLNIPCIGISSLESLAYNVENSGIICSLIDAKNNNVYFGLFEKKTTYKKIEEFSFKTIYEAIYILAKKGVLYFDLNPKNIIITNTFSGKLNGNNHVIRNIQVPDNYKAVFYNLSGSICNLTIENYSQNIINGNNTFGFISNGNSTSIIDNVHIKNANIYATDISENAIEIANKIILSSSVATRSTIVFYLLLCCFLHHSYTSFILIP